MKHTNKVDRLKNKVERRITRTKNGYRFRAVTPIYLQDHMPKSLSKSFNASDYSGCLSLTLKAAIDYRNKIEDELVMSDSDYDSETGITRVEGFKPDRPNVYRYWRATWLENGKGRSKQFSFAENVLEEKIAKKKARKHRAEMVTKHYKQGVQNNE